jgi:GNAT superfamily N-acetyltransferase
VTPPRLDYLEVGPDGAERVHALYRATPAYFDTLSIPMPSVDEVRTDLATAEADPRRITRLVVRPGVDGASAEDVAYLDVTLDYLGPGDATVNLLLVRADRQRQGVGRSVVADLERRLRGRCQRVLASVFGRNPHARRFWTSQGYHFAIDAAPVLEWYAKRLATGDRVDPGADLAVLDGDARS